MLDIAFHCKSSISVLRGGKESELQSSLVLYSRLEQSARLLILNLITICPALHSFLTWFNAIDACNGGVIVHHGSLSPLSSLPGPTPALEAARLRVYHDLSARLVPLPLRLFKCFLRI